MAKARKGRGHKGWFDRCVRHVQDAANRYDRMVLDPRAVCGAALREKRKKEAAAARRKRRR